MLVLKTNTSRIACHQIFAIPIYIVDNSTDSELFKKLCQQHNEAVPDRIVYSFSEKRYDGLDKDPRADLGIIVTLNEENPTVANVLVDHLHIHIMDMHLGKHFDQCS